MTACACGSGLTYKNCCQLYISGHESAPTPEALMRSRYTAHTLADVNYIERTAKGAAAAKFDRASVYRFAKDSEWVGLDIVHTHLSSPARGTVEFVAHYNDNKGRHQHLQEISEFMLEDGAWYYIDGKPSSHQAHHHHHAQPIAHTATKIGRNDPCECGSGKKFKKCCG